MLRYSCLRQGVSTSATPPLWKTERKNEKMISGFITAIRTLSILPAPGKDASNMASSLPWFPVVGLVLGGILFGIVYAVGLIMDNPWPEGLAALVVCGGVVLTRALHLDGLADFADGFGGRGDRIKTLAIMKDPHTGSFGVVAIVALLLVKWVSLAKCIGNDLSVIIIVACVASRAMMAELAATHPYARAEGTAAPFVKNARPVHRIMSLATGVALLVALVGPVVGLISFCIGWAVCRLFGFWCGKRLGGITGDVLGACSEITETTILFTAAFFSGVIPVFFPW